MVAVGRTLAKSRSPYASFVEEQAKEALAVGMDLAAMGVSAVPFAGGPLAGLLQGLTNRQFRRRLRMFEETVSALDHRLELLESRMADDDFEELVEDACSAADHNRSDDALRILGRTLAVAAKVEPFVGKAHLIVDVVAELAPEHVAVLTDAALHYRRGDEPWFHPTTFHGRPRDSFVYTLPNLEPVIDPVIAHLEGRGLLSRKAPPTFDFKHPQASDKPPEWASTEFGVEVVKLIAEPASDPPQ